MKKIFLEGARKIKIITVVMFWFAIPASYSQGKTAPLIYKGAKMLSMGDMIVIDFLDAKGKEIALNLFDSPKGVKDNNEKIKTLFINTKGKPNENDGTEDLTIISNVGKKYTITYSIAKGEDGDYYAITNADSDMPYNGNKENTNSSLSKKEIPLNDKSLFPQATVKVWDDSERLKVIVQNNFVFEIDEQGNKNKKAECSELPIKNGNQFFSTQGGFNDYLKVLIDNTGLVKLYCATESGEKKYLENPRQHLTMKEIKDGFIIGKIDDTKFHPVLQNDNTKFNKDGYLYTGNKTQAVICILAFNYFK